jgi:signal transduction histidine kinase
MSSRFTNMPIRRKLMLINLLTSVVVMVLVGAAFFTYEYRRFRVQIVRQFSTLGSVTASNSTAALAFGDQDAAQEILSALKAQRFLTAAALYDHDGKLFARYPASLPDSSLPAAPAADGLVVERGFTSGFQPVVQGDQRLGSLYLKIDTGTAMKEWISASVVVALVAMLISLLVAYLLSRQLQRQISRPIMALAGTARSVSGQRDFTVRAEKFGDDELGVLTDAFNDMLAEIHKLQITLEQRVDERTSQLQAANNELQAFSYSVSHDLRAPLRHVLGFVDLLRENSGPSLDAKNLRYLTTISDAAKRMGTLIDDLLAFSRIGQSEMHKTEVNLDQLVQEALRDVLTETATRTIDWEVGSLPAVQADRALLRMVFANLIANAVKFTGGVERARIEIGSNGGGEHEEVIFIRDNGAGFDPKYIDKLFGVFQRLHSHSEFEGTGIGLANVQRIIRRHGGRVWAEGEVNKGASFYFTLPR